MSHFDLVRGPGVQLMFYDNLGEGWVMRCDGAECDFDTIPCRGIVESAQELEDHWVADHQAPA